MTDSKPRLVTRQEAADYAGISLTTIDRWLKADLLTTFRTKTPPGPGRPQIHVDLNQVDELIRPAVAS